MKIEKWQFVIETVILYLLGFMSIFRLAVFFRLRPFNCTSDYFSSRMTCEGNNWFAMILWGLIFILIIVDLVLTRQTHRYIEAWKKLWLFTLFLTLALASSIWSILPALTITKSIILIISSIAAVYLAARYDLIHWLKILKWFFVLVTTASLMLVIFFPEAGTMTNEPYTGSWRGIFWHRNYFGSFLAFGNIVFLFNIFIFRKRGMLKSLFDFICYILSILCVIKSNSAAGKLILILLSGAFILIVLWVNIKSRLKRIHYIIFGTALIAISVLTALNLDLIFGLFNRSTSLTGRLPLWTYLINHIVTKKPLLGYGYGAIWSFEGFRLSLQSHLGWGYPVLIGDNGLIDILLHLGWLGAGIISIILLTALVSVSKFAIEHSRLIAFFPLISVIYIILANITLSMFIELGYLVWILLIASSVFSFSLQNETSKSLNILNMV